MVTVDFEDLELYTICNKYRPELKDSPNVKHYLTLEHKYKNDLLSSMGIRSLKGGHSKGLPSLSSYPKESVAALAHLIEEAEHTYPNEKFSFYQHPQLNYFFTLRSPRIDNVGYLPTIYSERRSICVSFATPLPNWKRRGYDLIDKDLIILMRYHVSSEFRRLPLWVIYFNKRKQPSIRKFEPNDGVLLKVDYSTIDAYTQAFSNNVSFQHGSCLLCRT